MKVKEIIERINNSKFSSLQEAVKEVLNNINPLIEELNPDHYRWFTVSTSVFALDDGLVGITGVTDLKGDMDDSDCNYETKAAEYENFKTISYR